MIYPAASTYGCMRLGNDEDRPECSYISWFAMLFSAGMGIGLVFWGVAEPMNHFINPDGMDGLSMLQTGSIVAAFPFVFVMLFACVSLYKALGSEKC